MDKDDGGVFARYGWLRLLRRHIVVIVAALLLSWAYMGQSLTSCGTTLVGSIGGDHINGIIWLYTFTSHAWGGISHVTNFPFGENVAEPQLITSALHVAPTWLISKVVGPVCAWNSMVFVSYMFSALLMYAFIYWLLRSRAVALFAAIAAGFTPYHYWKTWGHLSYTQSELFIGLLWAFLAFWRRPTFKKSLLLGVLMAGLMYSDAYFILIGGIMMAVLFVYALFTGYSPASRQDEAAREYLQKVKYLLISVGLVIVAALPVLFVDYHYKSSINSIFAHTRGNEALEVETYGAHPIDFVLPSQSHPIGFLRRAVDNYRATHVYSNSGEYHLYLGTFVILLALWACAFAAYQGWLSKRKIPPADTWIFWVVGACAAVAIITGISSIAPSIRIFGIHPIWPTRIISHVTSYWRVFARLFLAIDIAVVTLAAIGFSLLLRRFKDDRYRMAFIVLVIALTVIDLMPINPFHRDDLWSLNNASPTYWWLRDQKDIKAIADYPILESPQGDTYFGDQIVHQKLLLNSYSPADPELLLHRALTGLGDSQTLGALRTLGINNVLLYNQKLPAGDNLRVLYGNFAARVARINPAVTPLDYVLVADDSFEKPKVDPNTDISCRQLSGPVGGLNARLLKGAAATQVNEHFVVKGQPGQSVIIYGGGDIYDSFRFDQVDQNRDVDITVPAGQTVHISNISPASAGYSKICDLGIDR